MVVSLCPSGASAGLAGVEGCRQVNSLTNANVGSATAEVAVHRRVDVLIGRFRLASEQRRRRHNLSCLAVTALRYVRLNPGPLDGMRTVGREPFDCGYRTGNRRDLRLARAGGFSIDMDGTCATLGDTAAVLGAFHVKDVSEYPQ